MFRVPLIFFFLAACVGLLLRLYFILPFDWLSFSNTLHAHSHTMFLGWIFNVLFLAYVQAHAIFDKRYKTLFLIIQGILIAMFISFLIQGYGAVSIILSTLHTFSIALFCNWMFSDFKKQKASVSIWFAKVSLILFLLSALGPFTLGALVSNGLGQTKWYYFSIYYYLHFQYNGVFIFGILSLFFHALEKNEWQFDVIRARGFGWLLLVALFPTYFLSTLWAKPALIFNVIGFVGACIQLIALYNFIQAIRSVKFQKVNPDVRLLVVLSFIALMSKLILQLISAYPGIAQLAFETRPFVIAYLHLVLIGVVTFFLLAWYLENRIVKLKSSLSIKLMVMGFVGSELILVFNNLPYTSKLFVLQPSVLIFFFSSFLTAGIGLFLYRSYYPAIKQNS